jgi:predicted thioesterase
LVARKEDPGLMKQILKPGDIKEYRTFVKPQDVAGFQGLVVHDVYATFALARDAEWTTRQFVLEMKDEDEEGIGTYLHINHQGPAFVDEEVIFTAKFLSLTGGELICAFEAKVADRIIATGETGQKILKLDKIKSIFNHG